jgi:hypothetical protein
MSANPRQFAAMTGATMFRSIESEKPSIFFDEAEQLNSEAATTMRSVLNVGYRKGQTIPRMVGDTIKSYATYCPKVFVLIGDVYDTLRDRSIILMMKKASPERRFVFSIATEEGETIRKDIDDAVKFSLGEIATLFREHQGLDFLQDRDAEIWTALFVLCHVFCPNRIRELQMSAVDMAAEKTAEARSYRKLKQLEDRSIDDSYAKRLVVDLYTLVLISGARIIPTGAASEALKGIPIAPWRKYRGDGITPHDIARMLSRFGVRPIVAATGRGKGTQKPLRCYRLSDLAEAMKHLK